MRRLIAALRRHARQTPEHAAIEDERGTLAYADLLVQAEALAARLRASSTRALGILADNGRGWVLADLAAHLAEIPAVPLPAFFTTGQVAHIVRTAGIDRILTDQVAAVSAVLGSAIASTAPFHDRLVDVRLITGARSGSRLPAGTRKITFTSGTTGEPKGVCLGSEQLEAAAESLRIISAADARDRHLCVLPLATLLENIAGVYTPMLAGATLCVPELATLGWSGSSALDSVRLLAAMDHWRAGSAILVPQMLQALVAAGRAGAPMPSSLRYLAVGGAPVSSRLLDAARRLGLPAFEGYGLSECASVVAANTPSDHRVGSVGRPLPHVRVAFADDGEILVGGVRWRGYLGEAPAPAGNSVVATGDLGHLDDDGFLYVTGRKKNIFITSFGRNVAPEWIERELISHGPILQAAVFGEARPFNTAVIVAHPAASADAVDQALAEANGTLPDYAHVAGWIAAREPFSPCNGLSTPNGRLRREAIFGTYGDRINALYQP